MERDYREAPITIKEAKRDIREQTRSQRGYWNNIVAATLGMVAEAHGKDAANNLIEQCGLEMLGWQKEE